MRPQSTLALNLLAALPAAPTASVPMFFGRRFLNARELIQTGLVRNHVMIRRLIAEGRLPPPLMVGRKLRVWDTIELQALIDRLAAERGGKGPVAEATGKVRADAKNSGWQAAHTDDGGTNAPPG